MNTHQSVLLEPAIAALVINKNGAYLDGTFGRGGHSQAVLDALSTKGRLWAIDRDPEAIAVADKKFGQEQRFEIIFSEFSKLASLQPQINQGQPLIGMLFDLGVSSPQLDNAERGFSFMNDGPLDMRMNPTSGESAADYIARVGEKELVGVLREFGEERFAGRIARTIVEAREEAPITRTSELAKLVTEVLPFKEKNKHPATRTFQAIRIAVNAELHEITQMLEQSIDMLEVGGRLVVISFHSLEDRLVKQFMKKHSTAPAIPKGIPVLDADRPKPRMKLIGKAIKADSAELSNNPRARSAVLRIAQRVY